MSKSINKCLIHMFILVGGIGEIMDISYIVLFEYSGCYGNRHSQNKKRYKMDPEIT